MNSEKNREKKKPGEPAGRRRAAMRRNGEKKSGGGWISAIADNLGRTISLILFAAGFLALVIIGGPSSGYIIGQPAPRIYRSPVDFEYLDRRATRDERDSRMQEAPLVFREDREQFAAAADRLRQMLETGSTEHLAPVIKKDELREAGAGLMSSLLENKDALLMMLDEMAERMVVSDADWGDSAPREPGSVIWRRDGEDLSVPAADVVVLSPECPVFQRLSADALSGLDTAEAAVAAEFLAAALSPNARLDIQASDLEADRAADIPPRTVSVRRGDLIIRRGELVGMEEFRRLRTAHRKDLSIRRGVWFPARRAVGSLLALLLFGWVFSRYYLKYRTSGEPRRSASQCIAVVILVLILLSAASFCISYGFPIYLVPLPALIMILALVFGQGLAFVLSAFFPAMIALLAGSAGVEYPVFLIGGMAAALLTGRVRTRGTLFRSGLAAGLVQAGVLLAFGLVSAENGGFALLNFRESPLMYNVALAFGNGLLSGFLVTVMLPGIEYIFGVTTDIRLLEWSDPNQPLLQRLLLEAPGTYHHSMVVGSLAADAAEAVGANPLLTRVSAYFHDVGKLKKPEYFAENMQEGESNPHDELAPTMSKLIITAHPRDGAEMAAWSGLPPAVQDIILQSHGTTVTGYFWDAAKKQAGGENAPPDADEFRYKLPKPLSKEAACVMLADAVESATRSMQTLGTGKIAETVHKIILDRLHDGQLDNSGLTIPDLSALQKALTRGLNAVFHKRVKYPDQEETREQRGNEGQNVP